MSDINNINKTFQIKRSEIKNDKEISVDNKIKKLNYLFFRECRELKKFLDEKKKVKEDKENAREL